MRAWDKRAAIAGVWVLGWLGCGIGDLACLEPERGERVRAVLEERASRLAGDSRRRLAAAVARAECELEVDAFLLLAMAERESGFDPSARGPAGGIGLLQVRPATAAEIARRRAQPWPGERALLDVPTNVTLGAAYLAGLRADWGSWEAALAAYNLGPARLRSLVRAGKPATSPYARAILARSREMQSRDASR